MFAIGCGPENGPPIFSLDMDSRVGVYDSLFEQAVGINL